MKDTTQQLQAELEAIIAWFESDEADIDSAAGKYERGMMIAKQLEKRLQAAENKITKLQKSFSA